MRADPAGLRVRIVDRAGGPARESRAPGIQARTLELFEKLGIASRCVAAGRPLRTLEIRDGARRLARVDLGQLDTPYPFVLTLPQADTERILLARLGELGGEVEWRTELALLDRGDDVVRARLRRGDRDEIVGVPWLVGCDGIHSTVRDAIGVPFEGGRHPAWMVVADVALEPAPVGADEARAFLSPDGAMAVLPLPDGQIRVAAPLPDPDSAAPPEVTPARLEALLRERTGAPVRIAEASWISPFHIHERIAARFRAGRVLLAGDAAHVHSPVGGQGMNTGIQDVFDLAWKLALVHHGRAHPRLLDTYEAERRPIAAHTLLATDLATRAVTLRRRAARWLRDRAVQAVARVGAVQRRLLDELAMLGRAYPPSAVIVDDAPRALRAGPRPGVRAPDVSWPREDSDGPVRLFDLLRSPRHVLLVLARTVTTEVADVLAMADRRADVLDTHLVTRDPEPILEDVSTIVDEDDACRRRYGVTDTGLYLIRPDGHVAWRCATADPARLERYLGRVLA